MDSNYTNYIKDYYNPNFKCISTKTKSKTLPKRIFRTDNSLQMKCDNIDIIINKPSFFNIYDQLQKLYNEANYTKYNQLVEFINEQYSRIDNINQKILSTSNSIKTLFDNRKKLFDFDKLSDKDFDLLNSRIIKNKEPSIKLISGISNKSQAENYINYIKMSFLYTNTHNQLNNLYNDKNILINNIRNNIINYFDSTPSVQILDSNKKIIKPTETTISSEINQSNKPIKSIKKIKIIKPVQSNLVDKKIIKKIKIIK